MSEGRTRFYRRRGFWFLVWLVCSFVLVQELGDALRGPAWATYLASGCVLLVWVVVTFLVANWADDAGRDRQD